MLEIQPFVNELERAATADIWNIKPLQNADVVVRGEVRSVSAGTMRSADYWMLPEGATEQESRVTFVTLRVHEVLRGPELPPEWTFMVSGDPAEAAGDYPIGQEMLICAFYHTQLNTYYHTAPTARYMRSADGWIANAGSQQIVVGEAELREKLAQVDIDSVARRAELIVEGVVVSVDTSAISGIDGASAELITMTLRVEETPKGHVDEVAIQVVVITRGRYWPPWRKDMPMTYEVGQRWLCMLKQNEHGWYPFAGANGFFRVEGEHLLYADRVRYWHSRERIGRAIRMSEGGDN